MYSYMSSLKRYWRSIVLVSVASWVVTLPIGCGSSGPPKLPPAKDLEAKLDPAKTKRKQAKGKGYDDISLRERKKLMCEAAKQVEGE